jgi:hypothetical protein
MIAIQLVSVSPLYAFREAIKAASVEHGCRGQNDKEGDGRRRRQGE